MSNKLTIRASGYTRPKQVNSRCQHNILAPYDKIYRCLDCGEVVNDLTGYKATTKPLHPALSTQH